MSSTVFSVDKQEEVDEPLQGAGGEGDKGAQESGNDGQEIAGAEASETVVKSEEGTTAEASASAASEAGQGATSAGDGSNPTPAVKEEPQGDDGEVGASESGTNDEGSKAEAEAETETATAVKDEPMSDTPAITADSLAPRTIPTPSKPMSEKVQKAREIVSKNPLDTEAWMTLWSDAADRPIAEARPIYEEFLEQFPASGRHWKMYVDHELKEQNNDQVIKLFHRCLSSNCLSIELWRTYAGYIRTLYADKKQGQENTIAAYEYALKNVGMDINSTPIWEDYLNYLKSVKVVDDFESMQRLNSLRSLYRRAIENTMQGVENIFREYETWENSMNKAQAKREMQEYQTKIIIVKKVLGQRIEKRKGINPNILSQGPGSKDDNQVVLWKQYISFEKANPHRLDGPSLQQRVTFTFNQALMPLYRYPEIWYEAAMYQIETQKLEDARKLFERGVKACPDSLLLAFAFADFEESAKNVESAKAIFEKLIADKPSPLCFIQYLKFLRRTSGKDAARKKFAELHKLPKCTYHVYVAFALMEFYVSKEKTFALKVFELGLKKGFLSESSFVYHYVNFLKHQNDEHNTRVLFQRVLNAIPKDVAVEIWDQFLEFECFLGDIKQVETVERNFSEAYGQQGRKTLYAAASRYRYLDLWPCSSSELEGYMKDPPADEPLPLTGKKAKEAAAAAAAALSSKFPRPDLSRMQPFTAELSMSTPTGLGVPPSVKKLMSLLPTPRQYQGPVVDVELLMNVIVQSNIAVPARDDTAMTVTVRMVPNNKPSVRQAKISSATANKKKRKPASNKRRYTPD